MSDEAEEAKFDARTQEQIQKLTAAKAAAVDAEDYEEAKRCKQMLDRLRQTGQMLKTLEDRKVAAVQNEDYDTAMQVKGEIDRLRASVEQSPQNNSDRRKKARKRRRGEKKRRTTRQEKRKKTTKKCEVLCSGSDTDTELVWPKDCSETHLIWHRFRKNLDRNTSSDDSSDDAPAPKAKAKTIRR